MPNIVRAIALFACIFVFGLCVRAQAQLLPHVEGEVVLRFEDSTPIERRIGFMAEFGLSVRYRYRSQDALWVRFDASIPVAEMLERLRARREIAWAHENALGRREMIPNDPSFGTCWALQNLGQMVNGTVGTPGADIDAVAGWALQVDASASVLAIIDSGCNLLHQDLSANLWANTAEIAGNLIDDDQNGFIDDVNGFDFAANDGNVADILGHGTNVTGVACARGNNGIGMTGVCWQSRTMILVDGSTAPQLAAAAAAIEYAAMTGARVANLSSAFPFGSFPVLQNAVTTAQNAGLILCVAAGNSGIDLDQAPNLPAAYTNDNIVVVGASDEDDMPAAFSNFGAMTVDVFAPGVSMWTTGHIGLSSYNFAGGTSFAAPIVSGCLALMRARNPSATHQTVIAALTANVDVLPLLSGLCTSGGRVNLNQALIGVGLPTAAPTPNPMNFAVAPHLFNPTTARMIAAVAAPSPVEYRFDLVTVGSPGGTSSAWQSGTNYFDFGLVADTPYAWTVKARNQVSLTETAPSAAGMVWTAAQVPGAVSIASFTNESLTIGGLTAAQNQPTTEYSVSINGIFVGPGGGLQPTRHWQTASAWMGVTVGGLFPGTSHAVRARARNGAGVETADGPQVSITTAWLTAAAGGVVGTGAGGPFDVFTVNGSAGGSLRVVDVTVGSAFTSMMQTPPTTAGPSHHALLGWIGVPTSLHEVPIGGPFGTLLFPPCLGPGAPPQSFVVWSTFGPAACGVLYPALPTPFSAFSAGFAFALPDLTLQAVIEESPGQVRVGNGLVLRYR